MELVFIAGNGFEQYFQTLSKNVNSVELSFAEDGVVSSCLAQSALMYELKLTPEFFVEYDVDLPFKINVDCAEFGNLLKLGGKAESIKLFYNGEGVIVIEFMDSNKTIKHTLLEESYVEQRKMPAWDFPNKFQLDVKELDSIVKDLQTIQSTYMIFEGHKDSMMIRSDSNDAWNEYKKEYDFDGDFFCESKYNLSLFSQMLKFDKISKEVDVMVGDVEPIILTFDGGEIVLKCALAPMLEED